MTAAQLLAAYPPPYESRVLVALSGGADSVSLLLALIETTGAEKMCAFHLNHSLRGAESDRDEDFCRALCERKGVEFHAKKRDVAAERRRGESVEDAARRIRYAELLDCARLTGCALVATAHTANDNAETILLNFARGAGGAGLSGIKPIRPLDTDRQVIRPLLKSTRAEVEAFLAERGEEFVTDSSNLSDDYSRNLVRHRILPELERINPRAVEHIAAAAESAREDDAMLCGVAAGLIGAAGREEGTLEIGYLEAVEAPLSRRMLRIAYSRVCGGTLERAHVEALERLCASDDPSGRLSLPNEVVARREYGELIFERASETSTAPDELPLVEGRLEFGEYVVLAERTISFPPGESAEFDPARPLYLLPGRDYTLRARREGDELRPQGRGMTKSIKKLFIELKIPAPKRAGYPIVACGGTVAALPGYAPGEGFGAPAGGEALCVRVFPKGE